MKVSADQIFIDGVTIDINSANEMYLVDWGFDLIDSTAIGASTSYGIHCIEGSDYEMGDQGTAQIRMMANQGIQFDDTQNAWDFQVPTGIEFTVGNGSSYGFFNQEMYKVNAADEYIWRVRTGIVIDLPDFVHFDELSNDVKWALDFYDQSTGSSFKGSLVIANPETNVIAVQNFPDDSGEVALHNHFFTPIQQTDASASNSSLYYSTTQSRLVWKDSGGTVNNLY